LFFIAFLFPFLVLCSYAFDYFDQSWNKSFFQYSLNSLLIASVVSALCVCCALILAFYKRLSASKAAAVPARLASMGYALPGTVLAIGVIIPLTSLDHHINAVFEYFELTAPGLILSGSIIAIIFAYVVRFSAIAVGSIESSLAKVTPSLDMVSVTLAIKPMRMLRKVHFPLVRKGCLAGALLVFIESMKELPAALLLRPFNFETLATYVYQYVSDEQLEQAALAAIVIVLVGLIPIIFLNRSLEQQHS
jgi:iron(III) transport system permease protein